MKYIRMHRVEADPMERGEYDKAAGRPTPADKDPAEAGYKVTYPDGYVSWCPKAQFEAAGRPCDGMTFGMAIEAMKRGRKVARAGWNGKGMWISMVFHDESPRMDEYTIWGACNKSYAAYCEGARAKVNPFISMKAADGSIVMGWLASQTDMLAEDWMVVV